jgi:hypothetical protein
MCALAQDFSRSRIFQGAISSQLTTWENPVFRGANYSSVVLELRQCRPPRTPNSAGAPPLGAPERSSFGVLEHSVSNSFPGNPAHERNLGPKRTRLGATFIKFSVKITN